MCARGRQRILGGMQNDELRKLSELIDVLRGENGCPWDREQEPAGIISDLVEEVYELQWAHAESNREEIREELGDVVFVLVFAIKLLAEDDPNLSLAGVTREVFEKIKRRHPHVFGNDTAKTKDEGLAHWNRMKELEKSDRRSNRFSDVPGALSPVRRAEKIQQRAAAVGFDWPDTRGIFDKIREELDELEAALADGDAARSEAELGDAMFSIINLSRFLGIDTDRALTATNAKFVKRFLTMEKQITAAGRDMTSMSLEEMDRYWEAAKRGE